MVGRRMVLVLCTLGGCMQAPDFACTTFTLSANSSQLTTLPGLDFTKLPPLFENTRAQYLMIAAARQGGVETEVFCEEASLWGFTQQPCVQPHP